MLKQRVITAIVLGPIVISAIFSLHEYFPIFAGFVFSIAAWEWARLIGLRTIVSQLLYVFLMILLMVISWLFFADSKNLLLLIFSIAFLAWIMNFFYVLGYAGMQAPKKSFKIRHGLMGVLVLIVPFLAIIVLQANPFGPGYFLGLLLLLWIADSAAYFTGKRWGTHKLASRVSPGKTYEGVWGALIATAVYTTIVAVYFKFPTVHAFAIVVLSLAAVMFSILGDLLESRYKREADRKNSSNILPGHGGILDRIDSLTAAAPMFVLCLLVMGIPS